MSDFFSGLTSNVKYPDVVMQEGPLPPTSMVGYPAGFNGQADARINQNKTLLGDLQPYAYGGPARLSTQTSYLNIPHKTQRIIPELNLPTATPTKQGGHMFGLTHQVQDGDIAFVIKCLFTPGHDLVADKNKYARQGALWAIDSIVNLSTVNYILHGLQRYGFDKTEAKNWHQLWIALGIDEYMTPLICGENAQEKFSARMKQYNDMLNTLNYRMRTDTGTGTYATNAPRPAQTNMLRINLMLALRTYRKLIAEYLTTHVIVPLGVPTGSDKQGGQHQAANGNRGGVVGPVDFVTSLNVDGKCINMANFWKHNDINAGDDLMLIVTEGTSTSYTLSHHEKSMRTERFAPLRKWEVPKCLVEEGRTTDRAANMLVRLMDMLGHALHGRLDADIARENNEDEEGGGGGEDGEGGGGGGRGGGGNGRNPGRYPEAALAPAPDALDSIPMAASAAATAASLPQKRRLPGSGISVSVAGGDDASKVATQKLSSSALSAGQMQRAQRGTNARERDVRNQVMEIPGIPMPDRSPVGDATASHRDAYAAFQEIQSYFDDVSLYAALVEAEFPDNLSMTDRAALLMQRYFDVMDDAETRQNTRPDAGKYRELTVLCESIFQLTPAVSSSPSNDVMDAVWRRGYWHIARSHVMAYPYDLGMDVSAGAHVLARGKPLEVTFCPVWTDGLTMTTTFGGGGGDPGDFSYDQYDTPGKYGRPPLNQPPEKSAFHVKMAQCAEDLKLQVDELCRGRESFTMSMEMIKKRGARVGKALDNIVRLLVNPTGGTEDEAGSKAMLPPKDYSHRKEAVPNKTKTSKSTDSTEQEKEMFWEGINRIHSGLDKISSHHKTRFAALANTSTDDWKQQYANFMTSKAGMKIMECIHTAVIQVALCGKYWVYIHNVATLSHKIPQIQTLVKGQSAPSGDAWKTIQQEYQDSISYAISSTDTSKLKQTLLPDLVNYLVDRYPSYVISGLHMKEHDFPEKLKLGASVVDTVTLSGQTGEKSFRLHRRQPKGTPQVSQKPRTSSSPLPHTAPAAQLHAPSSHIHSALLSRLRSADDIFVETFKIIWGGLERAYDLESLSEDDANKKQFMDLGDKFRIVCNYNKSYTLLLLRIVFGNGSDVLHSQTIQPFHDTLDTVLTKIKKALKLACDFLTRDEDWETNADGVFTSFVNGIKEIKDSLNTSQTTTEPPQYVANLPSASPEFAAPAAAQPVKGGDHVELMSAVFGEDLAGTKTAPAPPPAMHASVPSPAMRASVPPPAMHASAPPPATTATAAAPVTDKPQKSASRFPNLTARVRKANKAQALTAADPAAKGEAGMEITADFAPASDKPPTATSGKGQNGANEDGDM